MAERLFVAYDEIPDGTQCHRKTYITTALGGLVGAIGSAYSVVHNPADSRLEAVARIGRYTFTAAAVGAMFGLATCVSAQVREKPDDPLNYFIGGCAGGLTLGARAHNYGTAAAGCICMGTAASLFKIGKLEGWEFFATRKV
ncbi:NADH dehydrogenase [ubiquinone] 1 alpha subcomplex subunit 11 [Meriones unguiculatus]|uniref:NADH dehydrogenase [ubiquinone] 1 alpha subcomplex subunit 11 n=1 Tax=Meriones unguiculatus TaxID=10047 RepID=UPI000B4F60FC|nr:NADH dehydrogenase [ubiquinone] 1 alpha subcomplex subunit 11 [Meriones unguiculatus]